MRAPSGPVLVRGILVMSDDVARDDIHRRAIGLWPGMAMDNLLRKGVGSGILYS